MALVNCFSCSIVFVHLIAASFCSIVFVPHFDSFIAYIYSFFVLYAFVLVMLCYVFPPSRCLPSSAPWPCSMVLCHAVYRVFVRYLCLLSSPIFLSYVFVFACLFLFLVAVSQLSHVVIPCFSCMPGRPVPWF